MGNLHFDKGEYKEAEKYIDKALNLATKKNIIAPIYLSKGKLFLFMEQLDSAKFYLNKCLQSPYIYTKAGSLQRLAQISLKEKKTT